MDGKQRLSTVADFLNDKFELTKLDPVVYYDEELDLECEEDITGYKFSQLPEAIKDIILTASFSIVYYTDMTNEEERQMFKRLNSGKALSTKSRTLASCKDLDGILNIGKHELFSQMLTAKALDNKDQATIVMKCWAMLNKELDDVTFESKVFNPMIENTEITEAEKNEINEVLNKIVELHDELVERGEKVAAKKLYTEMHMVALVPILNKYDVPTRLWCDWFVGFFSEENETYNSFCMTGTAKNVNVKGRTETMEESFKAFFTEE